MFPLAQTINYFLIDSSAESVLQMLPPVSQIFHGREAELEDVLDCLKQDSPRIAILGPGGIGKTCLAIAALHDPRTVENYQHRYFISCHSSRSYTELVANLAVHLRLERKSTSKILIQHLSASPPTLLVLDNFETPWETPETRSDVERFLSMLANIHHLALLVRFCSVGK